MGLWPAWIRFRINWPYLLIWFASGSGPGPWNSAHCPLTRRQPPPLYVFFSHLFLCQSVFRFSDRRESILFFRKPSWKTRQMKTCTSDWKVGYLGTVQSYIFPRCIVPGTYYRYLTVIHFTLMRIRILFVIWCGSSFQIKAKIESVPYILACHLQIDVDPAYHFDADPYLDPNPTFQIDADPDSQHWYLRYHMVHWRAIYHMVHCTSMVSYRFLIGGHPRFQHFRKKKFCIRNTVDICNFFLHKIMLILKHRGTYSFHHKIV